LIVFICWQTVQEIVFYNRVSGLKAVEQTLMEVGKLFLCCSLKKLDILRAIHGLSLAILPS